MTIGENPKETVIFDTRFVVQIPNVLLEITNSIGGTDNDLIWCETEDISCETGEGLFSHTTDTNE